MDSVVPFQDLNLQLGTSALPSPSLRLSRKSNQNWNHSPSPALCIDLGSAVAIATIKPKIEPKLEPFVVAGSVTTTFIQTKTTKTTHLSSLPYSSPSRWILQPPMRPPLLLCHLAAVAHCNVATTTLSPSSSHGRQSGKADGGLVVVGDDQQQLPNLARTRVRSREEEWEMKTVRRRLRSELLKCRFAIINSCNSTPSTSKSYHTRRCPPRRPASEPPRRPSRLLQRKPIPFIDDLKQTHAPEDLLSLFHDYRKMGFKHYYPSYSSLIYKLAKSRNFEGVDTLLGGLKTYNVHCREALFIGLIEHYGKCGLVEKAIHLFREMKESFNCVRSIQSFNTLLNVLVENGRHCEAYDMFKGSSKLGFRPNSVSFNIMIKMYLEKGEHERAREVFDEMLEREVEPTAVTYNSQIGFLCKRGEFEKGKSLFEDMVRKGTKPNEVTYALLMEGLCFLGRYKDAKKLMFDMEYQGCKPKVVNYGVLVSDLGKRGKIEEAKSLLVEMKKRHIKPDAVIYNMLISYFCREDRAAEAYRVLVEMQIAGCKPNATTYRMVVDGFCKAGEFEEGLKVFNAMLMSGHFPRTETLRSLVMGLFDCGKVDDAYFILEEMAKRKKMFDFESWEAIVKDSCTFDKAFNNHITEIVSSN
nr:pentatricopeptide repeat-containing protein At1g07740, mitochondrial [Ipomoea trifida]